MKKKYFKILAYQARIILIFVPDIVYMRPPQSLCVRNFISNAIMLRVGTFKRKTGHKTSIPKINVIVIGSRLVIMSGFLIKG
jgi:hypothetical protein